MMGDLAKPTIDLLLATKAIVDRDIAQGFVTPEQLRYQFTRAARKEAAQKLAAEGMSTRQIAEVTGASQRQIARDISEPNGSNPEPNGSHPKPPKRAPRAAKPAAENKDREQPEAPAASTAENPAPPHVEPEAAGEKLPKQNHPIDPVDRCAMTIRSTVLQATRDLPPERWTELFAALRDELADVEKTAESHRDAA